MPNKDLGEARNIDSQRLYSSMPPNIEQSWKISLNNFFFVYLHLQIISPIFSEFPMGEKVVILHIKSNTS